MLLVINHAVRGDRHSPILPGCHTLTLVPAG